MPLTDAPRLLSERLILRGPEPRDMEPVIAFLQDETRASGFGHIPERGAAWRWFVAAAVLSPLSLSLSLSPLSSSLSLLSLTLSPSRCLSLSTSLSAPAPQGAFL